MTVDSDRRWVLRIVLPSLLASLSWGKALMLVYVRPSNDVTDDPSKLARSLFRDGG